MANKKQKRFENMDPASLRKMFIIRLFFTVTLMLGILLLSAGRWDWWKAWMYTALTILITFIGRAVTLKNDPDLIVERISASTAENVKPWDRKIVPLIAIYLPLITWVIIGLDERFDWSPDMPDSVQWAALFIIFAGNLFAAWATYTNRFFSSHVRIQSDRGHHVIQEGPYRFVRHPGYLGGIMGWLFTPIFFGSRWAWIPAALTIAGYIYRTSLEDKTLQEELEGYKAYAQKVRYRLFPGLW